jgi:hypothetical protein
MSLYHVFIYTPLFYLDRALNHPFSRTKPPDLIKKTLAAPDQTLVDTKSRTISGVENSWISVPDI